MIQEEIYPIVDEIGNVVGQASRNRCHDGSRLLHPVVHLHIFNSNGELFLQKRSCAKDVQPNLWDSSSAGHIDLNEKPEEAVVREASEELGIKGFEPHFITSYIIENDREKELSYCYYTIYDGEIRIDHNEVADGRFWTLSEIEKQIGSGIFTMNFESDFRKFLSRGVEGLTQIRWVTDTFSHLDNETLYRILDLRNRVFIIEQHCVYPDLDYKDQQAIHLQGYMGNVLVAYCRIFMPCAIRQEASIGRVSVDAGHRRSGYGRKLMKRALDIIGDEPISISAQLYLEEFYRSFGFISVGEPFSDAGILHIKMNKE